jgi:hypothetical protein
MLLVYWNDQEVSKYESFSDFMYGRENFNNVHMATALRIENGEIKATHWSVDDLEYAAQQNEQYHRS